MSSLVKVQAEGGNVQHHPVNMFINFDLLKHDFLIGGFLKPVFMYASTVGNQIGNVMERTGKHIGDTR
jgi:hypothetical protein